MDAWNTYENNQARRLHAQPVHLPTQRVESPTLSNPEPFTPNPTPRNRLPMRFTAVLLSERMSKRRSGSSAVLARHLFCSDDSDHAASSGGACDADCWLGLLALRLGARLLLALFNPRECH